MVTESLSKRHENILRRDQPKALRIIVAKSKSFSRWQNLLFNSLRQGYNILCVYVRTNTRTTWLDILSHDLDRLWSDTESFYSKEQK